jgi:YHS domain-containing protein
MKRQLVIFLATFVAGAFVAFAARTALHEPHGAAVEHTAPEHSAMVNNALTPVVRSDTVAGSHDGHGVSTPAKPVVAQADSSPHDHAKAGAAPAASAKPVNTVCAICGMEVDPKIPTAEYQGKTIGFGCKMCPPKFKAAPDKYGPSYLRNEVLKR